MMLMVTYFALMATLLLLHGLFEVIKMKNYYHFELPNLKNIYFDISDVYDKNKNRRWS